MLLQKRRVKKDQIKEILKRGKIFSGREISLKTIFIPKEPSAFAVIVSSKTEKKAVKRNLLKRRGKAVIFKTLPFLKEGFLTLVFFKKESAEMKFSKLEEEIRILFLKAGILN